jgi:hypothetical protein
MSFFKNMFSKAWTEACSVKLGQQLDPDVQ